MRIIKTMSNEDLLMCSVDLVSKTYGDIAVNNILKNTKVKLKRKILGD